MEGKSTWNVNNGAGICYGTTIEVKNNGILSMGYTFMNTGSVIVCSKKIDIGNEVWIGRNNIIYDNDHHRILDNNNNITNKISPVKIGNKVWITNHVFITKGVQIGDGVIISPYSLIRKNIESEKLVGQFCDVRIFNEKVNWSSELIK